MTSDLCGDAVVSLSNSEIISSESVSPARAVSVGDVVASSAAGGVSRASSTAMELGRRLLVAARSGDTIAVLDLMAKGAPFTADWLGTSPLHLAAQNAHAETCAVLLRSGVSRDLRTKVERTPLHLAAYAGHAHIVKLLLEHDAQVDCRDMLRMTPLHWAVERGHSAVAAILLRHGADPSALSKFYKTPHSLALELQNNDMLKIIEDTFKEREAAVSVDALVSEHMAETAPDPNIQNFESIVQKIKETKPSCKLKEQQEKPARVDSKITQNESSGNKAAAAQLLRKHGITLLPTDDSSTVLNAIQSGRTVVLSDAGKLMLKESENEPSPKKTISTSQKGVVLTATPVKSPPKPGMKIFTLNNKLITLPKENNKLPIKKIINPQLKQVKIVKLTSDSKIIATNKASIPMKAKNKVVARPVVSAVSNRTPAPIQRQAVKIIMNKSNFNKLLANADNSLVENIKTEINQNLASSATESKTLEEDVDDILRVQEDFLLRCSTKYLRTHALAARRALVALKGQLDHYKARLSQYELADG